MGQFAVTTFIAIVLILYFMGFSEKLNNAVINAYQVSTGGYGGEKMGWDMQTSFFPEKPGFNNFSTVCPKLPTKL